MGSAIESNGLTDLNDLAHKDHKMTNGNNTAACFNKGVDYGAVVIGAGFGGLRILHEFRKLGLTTRLIEAGSDVGGTWYWNRYPGARTDSESWTYILNFSQELKMEWTWKERFAPQAEVLDYLQHVAHRFDMRKDIDFNTRVKSAHYDSNRNIWHITTLDGTCYTCHFFITAAGVLSAARDPPFPGLDSFEGKWYQTSNWPKEKVDFGNKRVAVIGTGATGVQVIPIVAHTAKSVTVFQRTPNYVIPARNATIPDSQLEEIKTNYNDIWSQARRQVFGFAMPTVGRTVSDVKDEKEHYRILEAGWEAGGFRYIFETFDDLLLDVKSNAVASEFIREKIRTIVKDPKTADMLCPDYPLLAKRPPLGHFYYEAFNRPNVTLVSVADEPIRTITPKGLRTGTTEYEFDIIIFAIGFDAVTGALNQIDIRGENDQSLSDQWNSRLETFLGITNHGYPNMFMISGPQAPFANMPIIIDNTVDWVGKLITFVTQRGYNHVDTTQKAVDRWCDHVAATFGATLLATASKQARSWYIGANVPGKPLSVLFYFGGLVEYFAHCLAEYEKGFPSLQFTRV